MINSKVFDVKNNDEYEKVLGVFLKIKPELKKDKQNIIIRRFYDVIGKEEDEKVYSVYKINLDFQIFVLKKTEEYEIPIYEKFLIGKNLPVPKMLGHTIENNEEWILIEYIEGEDLKKFNRQIALNSADSLSKVFNTYWIEDKFEENKLDNRFERYYTRIIKRSKCLKHHIKLEQAYKIFLERQLTCPRTLCNGDLLPINAINNEFKVIIIDWNFGGIMPYSLDIARLIAHGAEDDDPFYITDELKNIFIDNLYDKLRKTNLTYEQYLWDIKLSTLNEYIEFLEYNFNNPNEEKDHYYNYYLKRANKIANEILNNMK